MEYPLPTTCTRYFTLMIRRHILCAACKLYPRCSRSSDVRHENIVKLVPPLRITDRIIPPPSLPVTNFNAVRRVADR